MLSWPNFLQQIQSRLGSDDWYLQRAGSKLDPSDEELQRLLKEGSLSQSMNDLISSITEARMATSDEQMQQKQGAQQALSFMPPSIPSQANSSGPPPMQPVIHPRDTSQPDQRSDPVHQWLEQLQQAFKRKQIFNTTFSQRR